jgi:hypothetical protein
LAGLVKELDNAVADNSASKLAAVVNLIGGDAADLKKSAEKLGADLSPKHVAIVVPNDAQNGPKSFAISPDAEVTVMLYKGKKVVANHALKPGGLKPDGVKAILADVSKLVEK